LLTFPTSAEGRAAMRRMARAKGLGQWPTRVRSRSPASKTNGRRRLRDLCDTKIHVSALPLAKRRGAPDGSLSLRLRVAESDTSDCDKTDHAYVVAARSRAEDGAIRSAEHIRRSDRVMKISWELCIRTQESLTLSRDLPSRINDRTR